MMRLKTRLNVSAEFLYQRLVQTALDDVSQNLGHPIAISELAGARYQAGNEATKAEVTITQAAPNQSYHYVVELAEGQLIRSFDLRELASDQVELVYQSQLIAKNWLRRLELSCSNFFLGWLKIYNLKRLFKKLELGYN